MSRSYKRIPYTGDKKNKEDKRNANKAVRRYLKDNYDESHHDKKFFKKIFDSYDICDFFWIKSWKEFYEENKDSNKSKKQLYREWYTQYKRK